ncbi:MAG: OsmC family protein [Chloroflexi bacterium]|nr:OsmC family protein [Chloroflexota bacterium]
MATATKKMNGVDVTTLVATVDAIKKDPSLARCRFRSTTRWIDGGHSQTRIQGFYGAGKEDDSRKRPFIMEGDEPPVLLGANNGANAVEAVLHALASCLAVGYVYNAAARGITIKSLEFQLEGDLDLQGFLGLNPGVRPGYNQVRVTYKVESDAPRKALEELCEYVQSTSPVLDILRNPVAVQVEMV